MRKKIILSLSLVLCIVLSGCCLSHEWQTASCTAPKTCVKCQKTEGEPLEHTWVEADCETAKTCKVCGTTEGDPLGHTLGEWEQVSLDPITLVRERVKHCTVCEKLLEEETETLTTLHEDGKFLLTLDQIYERLNYMMDKVIHEIRPEYQTAVHLVEQDNDNVAVIEVYKVNNVDLALYAKMACVDEDDVLVYDNRNVCPMEMHVAAYRDDPLGDWSCIILAMVIDPSLTDFNSSLEMLNQSTGNGGKVTHNGISYSLYISSGMRFMDVYIAE